MKLYLMRHGQAAHPLQDPEQGLTQTGRLEIERLAQRLAQKGISFEQAFHSEKARARQTAEIMAAFIAPGLTPQQRAGLKPNDDPQDMLPTIDSWEKDTLIASHLPFVPSLLVLLTQQAQDGGIAPGTIFCLAKEGDNWRIEWCEEP